MTNTYFKNVNTLEELRKQYKELLKIHHPDNGGNNSVFLIHILNTSLCFDEASLNHLLDYCLYAECFTAHKYMDSGFECFRLSRLLCCL